MKRQDEAMSIREGCQLVGYQFQNTQNCLPTVNAYCSTVTRLSSQVFRLTVQASFQKVNQTTPSAPDCYNI
jgi:hypothetical protein